MATFPFFRLPRELRDRIYEEVGGQTVMFNLGFRPKRSNTPHSHQEDRPTHPSLGLRIRSYPLTSCLVVSRVFKEEYEKETRRHSVARALRPLDEDKSKVPTELLQDHTRLHKCLSVIPRLEVRFWGVDGRDKAATAANEQIHKLILPYMDSIKCVTDDLVFQIDDLESARAAMTCDQVASALEKHCIPDLRKGAEPGDEPIPFNVRIHFQAPLVSMSKSYEPTDSDHEKYPLMHETGMWETVLSGVRTSHMNNILYRATPTDDGCFDFTTLNIDRDKTFDYDGMMTEWEGNVREMMGFMETVQEQEDLDSSDNSSDT